MVPLESRQHRDFMEQDQTCMDQMPSWTYHRKSQLKATWERTYNQWEINTDAFIQYHQSGWVLFGDICKVMPTKFYQ